MKLRNLSSWDRDVGEAVRWLRNNKDKFRMEVFEPPALSVRVPDQAFAAAVENSFNASQMKVRFPVASPSLRRVLMIRHRCSCASAKRITTP